MFSVVFGRCSTHLAVGRVVHDASHVAALYARHPYNALVDRLNAPEATCGHNNIPLRTYKVQKKEGGV